MEKTYYILYILYRHFARLQIKSNSFHITPIQQWEYDIWDLVCRCIPTSK